MKSVERFINKFYWDRVLYFVLAVTFLTTLLFLPFI